MKSKRLLVFLLPCLLIMMYSCLGDSHEETYAEWRSQNITFIEDAASETIDGVLKYEKIIPNWNKSVYTLMRWHEEGKETNGSLLTPLSNSTIDVKYLLTNINGDTLDSSSSFRCKPNEMITGFWIAVTNMVEGDSVTAIIPYDAGYGVFGSGKVLPYSTLIFNIRLDSIVAYESLPWRN